MHDKKHIENNILVVITKNTKLSRDTIFTSYGLIQVVLVINQFKYIFI